MKRALAFFSTVLLTLAMVVGAPASAQAAPLPAGYSAAAGGAVLTSDVDVEDAVNLAGISLATAQSTVDPALSPEVRSRSSNLAAAVAGLDLDVAFQQETAPPDNEPGAEQDQLAAVEVAGVGAGLLTTSNEAHYVDDSSCVPGNLLADSRVQTVGAVVAPAGLTAARTGDSTTQGVTELVPTTGLNRAVRSTATGTISGVELLDGTVAIGISGASTLTAEATGVAGGATVAYVPGTVTATVDGDTTTIDPGTSETFAVVAANDVEGSVTVTANDATIVTTPDGRSATATVAVVTAELRLGPVGDALATATVDLLPLNASAAAPNGGIDCAPAPPVVTTPADGSTTDDTTPPISGTGLVGAVITLTLDDDIIAEAATVDGDGNWTYTPANPLAPGAHAVSATQTVAAATSATSNTNDFTVESTVPGAEAPTLVSPADGSSTRDTTPPFTGKAQPGDDVEVFVDGKSIGTDTADAGGDYSVTPDAPLAVGPHEAYAEATDDNGDTSVPSTTNAFQIDLTAPEEPVLDTPDDYSVIEDTTPTFSGTAEPNAEVEIFVDDESIGTTTAGTDGKFSFTPTKPLTQDVHQAHVRATDGAGNVSPRSDTTTFLVYDESTAPTLITPPDESKTNDSTPDFTGLAQPGARVDVFVDDEIIGSDVADDDGRYSVTPTVPLADGQHYAYAVATGPDGPAESDFNEFLTDTRAPAQPVIAAPGDGDVVSDGTLIAGSAEPGSTVTIFIDGRAVGDVVADDNGRFRYFPAVGELVGEHTITATSTDDTGNVSAPSRAVRVTGVEVNAPDLTPPGDNGGNGPGQAPHPVDNAAGSTTLANTGGPSALLGLLGGLLICAGAVAMGLGRRRRLRSR